MMRRFAAVSMLCTLALVSCRPAGPAPAGPAPGAPTPVTGAMPRTEPLVRIGLFVDSATVAVSGTGEFEIASEAGTLKRASAGDVWTIAANADGRLVASGPQGALDPVMGTLTVRPRGDSRISIGGKPYRGAAVIRATGPGKLIAINSVTLEDYLLGVVPHELGRRPASEIEALKTQAVAARTYAIGALGSRASLGFDMYATTADQVYGGAGSEDTITSRAVTETAGEVVAYQGKPIIAYYSSTCGERTAAIEDSWPWKPIVPYLRSVSDKVAGSDSTYYNQPSNRFHWTQSWSGEQLEAILSKSLQSYLRLNQPVQTKPLTAIEIVRKNASLRVDTLRIEAGGKSYIVRADSIRWVLRPDSARILNSSLLYSIDAQKDASGRITKVDVSGGGWGHGVGMCQWGAIGRARAGQDYRTILKAYYTGVDIVDLY